VSYDVAKAHARGVWYVSQWIYDERKWSVWTPEGVAVALASSKREAVAEMLRLVREAEKCSGSSGKS